MRWLASSIAIPVLCGCIGLTVEPRAIVSGPDGTMRATMLNCDAAELALSANNGAATGALEHRPLRLLIWNIHKEGDFGWQRDLSSLAIASDVVLLQETVLQSTLRNILGDAGLSWVMASSFIFGPDDVGVLTATRVAPVASCTQRAVEPFTRIPKSAVITWLPIGNAREATSAGPRETLAIVNLHAINFEISLIAYRAQLEALTGALVGHRGPVIFAGDFNTWSDARDGIVAENAVRLGLTEVKLAVDQRALFFGRHLDHIFIRGLQIIGSAAIPVDSSDHNPVAATLRIP